MAMQRSTYPKSLEPGINAVWESAEKDYPDDWAGLYEVKTSNRAWEEQVLRVSLGIAPIRQEGTAFHEDAGGEFWTQRYINLTVGLKFSLTQEALEDNLYKDLAATNSRGLLRAMKETKAIMACKFFNDAFTTTMGDGAAFLSTSHPLWGGGTWSNKLATPADLSEASIEDLLVQISNAVSDRNLPTPVNAKQLVVGTANIFEAARILRSVQRVGTNENDINALKALGIFGNDPIVLRRLSDTDTFFITTDAPMGLQHFVRIGLQKGGQEDFNTGNYEYKARERYCFGGTNQRSLYGTEGN